jgi:hypothetical protein
MSKAKKVEKYTGIVSDFENMSDSVMDQIQIFNIDQKQPPTQTKTATNSHF